MDPERPPTSEPLPDDTAPEAGGRRRLFVIGSIAVLAGLLAIAGWVVAIGARGDATQWQDRAEARGDVVIELESALETANEEVEAANGELAATSESLAAAQARIDELASEIAGTEDEREAAIITVDQLEELLGQAGLVAADLDTCATGAVEVVGIVTSLGDYDLEEVDAYVAEVEEVCGRALAENDALQGAIAALQAPTAAPEGAE